MPEQEFWLDLIDVEREPLDSEVERWRFVTNDGPVEGQFHPAGETTRAVIWVGGVNGGFDGPAGRLYPRLARQLAADGIASLRLDYRHPDDLINCMLDTLMGVGELRSQGFRRMVLVGHSSGGAVVITAGARTSLVIGVAALSSQTYGTNLIHQLSPRPVLLLHGEADSVLPDTFSRSLYDAALEPKRLILYPGCGHGLDECRDAVDRDLLAWIRQVFGLMPRG